MAENKNKIIAVAGYGHVGKSMVAMLKDHYNVLVFDPQYNESNNFESVKFVKDLSELKTAVLGIICVPTPMAPDGGCDTSLVEEAVKKMEAPVILIKSTVKPGTTDRLKKETGKRIVFSPEYVGDSKYYNPYFNTDMKAVPFFAVGGSSDDSNYVLDLMFPILGPTKQYYKTSAINAEMMKYMANTFFAAKITFVNEMYEICKALGADWYEVREGWLLDPRIERMHTAVFPEKRGFDGKCFPKDVSAIIKASLDAGYDPKLLVQMQESNEEFKKKNRK
jgi:nucleotide sugar dehydrogenase